MCPPYQPDSTASRPTPGCRTRRPGTGAAPPRRGRAGPARPPRSSPSTASARRRFAPAITALRCINRRRSAGSSSCPIFPRSGWGSCPSFSPRIGPCPTWRQPTATSTRPRPVRRIRRPAEDQISSSTPPSARRWNQPWTVLLGPYLAGSSLHWHPLRIRKMIPLNVRLQWAGGRPVDLRGQDALRIGSILAHNFVGDLSQIVPSGFRRAIAPAPVAGLGGGLTRYNPLRAKGVPDVFG